MAKGAGNVPRMRIKFPPRIKHFFALGLLAGALVGCGPGSKPAEQGILNKVLNITVGTEPEDIDPHVVTGVPEHHIIAALTDGLVGEDPVDLHPVPGTAETWEVSDGGRVYTFHLRESAKWTNGDPVTANDLSLIHI